MSSRRRRATRALLATAASVIVGKGALAQATPCPVLARDSARVWAAPLDRVVTLQASGASLRTALDLVAARAQVRLSYSSDLLPLDREACVPQGAMPLGAALAALLSGLPVTPTVSGGLQVVLAPARGAVDVSEHTATLDRVVVTGTASGGAQRSLPYAIDVVQGRDQRGAAAPSLATMLNGSIPGLWIWGDSPTTLLARYGSVRGASSFGVSAPKVFVDGIELANPLLLTRISADAIERIEVIRGPQGAALYGADAISGVVNVQLRHDGASDGSRDATLRSSAGAAQSDYVSSGVFTQEHTLALRAGSAERSLGAVLGMTTTGAVVPGGSTRQFSADVSGRRVGRQTIASGTARMWVAQADSPVNPLLARIGAQVPGIGTFTPEPTQAVSQYTVGGTITHSPDEVWTNTLTVGVDGYRLSGLAVDYVPVPSALDSAMRSTRGGADKGTIRATAVRRYALSEQASATLTLLADAAMLRDGTSSTLPVSGAGPGTPPPESVRWLSTGGLSVQGGVSLRETFYLSAGLRGERNDGFTDASRFALLPALGASVVKQVGDFTWKGRVAYGAGMRPARTPVRETAWRGAGFGTIGRDLLPERQAGVEAGVDLFWKRALSLQVTRFDQRASSLIQQVPVAYGPARIETEGGEMRRAPRVGYVLTNLGAITNRGWEFALRQNVGTLSLTGTMSLVQSIVDQVAPRYAGDLRPGDRMLAVPARMSGLTLTWLPRNWQMQVGATQVADWINYDRLALSSTWLRGGAPADGLTGAALRPYWLQYGAVTRVRASVMRDLTSSLTLRLIGDNLLDRQRGEPDNVTIMSGRTFSFGIAARF